MNIKKTSCRFIVVLILIYGFPLLAAKNIKIKLTGSLYEAITMSIGNTGRTEIITSLPHTIEVEKSDLPMRLSFSSSSFKYYDIDVPEKPFDTTGHVYLVKVNETAMPQSYPIQNTPALPNFLNDDSYANKGFDSNHGVNAAPKTNIKDDKTFALIISNEIYEMAANVENATNDGLAFKEYCLKTLGIPKDNIKYANNLSYGKMRKTINDVLDLVDMLKGEGNLIIYYAGHGIPDNKSKDAFLMPVDADGTDTDVCIPLSELYHKIDSRNLNRCIVFLDACFSGAQRGGEMIVSARGVKLKPKEIIPEGKTIVFSATSNDQAAFSHKEKGHGLFTYFLLLKLQETKGKTSLGELAKYLQEKVEFESRRINNSPQTPKVSVSPGLSNKWESMKLIR